MKLILIIFFLSPHVWSQNLSPDEQRALLKEVQSLKERVNQLEKKESGQGFKSTDYSSQTTESASVKAGPSSGPAMTAEQRKEMMEAMEKLKKARIEQEKALKELEDEE